MTNPKTNPPEIEKSSGKGIREIAVQAKLCPGHQHNASARFHEKLQMNRNLWRRKLVEPIVVPGGLGLPFLDHTIEDKAYNTINQRDNNSYLRTNRTPERPDRRFVQNSNVFLERIIGSFGSQPSFDELLESRMMLPVGSMDKMQKQRFELSSAAGDRHLRIA